MTLLKRWVLLLPLAASAVSAADRVPTENHIPGLLTSDLPIDALPDFRTESPQIPLPTKRSDSFFVVPIPMSSPTFGTGLILGGAYFYPQTDAQKSSQPQSFTGAAAGYTSNKSWAGGVMQQNYWDGDQWRFNAIAGAMDFRLELVQNLDSPDESILDWLVSGEVVQGTISRRFGNRWFVGVTARYLDISQDLDLAVEAPEFSLESNIVSPGIGLNLEYDTRDMPSNPYAGSRLEVKSMFADQRNRNEGSYTTLSARYRAYHSLTDTMVLAWEVNGCMKSGNIPLWDTCRLQLRGFPVTDYLSKQSIASQIEARWRLSKRWGAVAFAGGGLVDRPFSDNGDGRTIPSYGIGARFTVLESQRINLRLDYARSRDGAGAIYLAVGEAF